jgi:hypothetical protein
LSPLKLTKSMVLVCFNRSHWIFTTHSSPKRQNQGTTGCLPIFQRIVCTLIAHLGDLLLVEKSLRARTREAREDRRSTVRAIGGRARDVCLSLRCPLTDYRRRAPGRSAAQEAASTCPQIRPNTQGSLSLRCPLTDYRRRAPGRSAAQEAASTCPQIRPNTQGQC